MTLKDLEIGKTAVVTVVGGEGALRQLEEVTDDASVLHFLHSILLSNSKHGRNFMVIRMDIILRHSFEELWTINLIDKASFTVSLGKLGEGTIYDAKRCTEKDLL